MTDNIVLLNDIERHDFADNGDGTLTIRATIDLTATAEDISRLLGSADPIVAPKRLAEMTVKALTEPAVTYTAEAPAITARPLAAVDAVKRASRVFPPKPIPQTPARYTAVQTLAAWELLQQAADNTEGVEALTRRGTAANKLMDLVPAARPSYEDLVILAQTITNRARHTYVPSTGAPYRDPCLICGHFGMAAEHATGQTTPLADLSPQS